MENLSLAEALQHTTFAGSLPAEVTQSLAEAAQWKHCPAGTVLFREGDSSDSFYVVHRGHVLLEMPLPGRGLMKLLTLGPGEMVAWSALVGDGRMTATATAVDDVDLIEWPWGAFLKRCETDPLTGYRVMRRLAAALAKRLLATRLQMLDMFHADQTSRGGDPG